VHPDPSVAAGRIQQGEERASTAITGPRSRNRTTREKQLTPEQYRVTRQHGTERTLSNPLNAERNALTFACVLRHAAVLVRDQFDSGTGWPSFSAPVDRNAVAEYEDRSWFMRRTEGRCASCDAI
jgi:peptide-methionine (R)-S-oxide reductase